MKRRKALKKPKVPNKTMLSTLDEFEVYVWFPHEYPADKCAEMFVRSDQLKRDNQSRLNKDLLNYLNEVFETDCAITSEAISWLQEHFHGYMIESVPKTSIKIENVNVNSAPVKLRRMWIYCHHMFRDCKNKFAD